MNKPARGRGERAGLSRDAILDGAVTLARASRTPVSVRLLAARVGVDPMAIHYWFGGRTALLDAAAATVLDALARPEEPAEWEEAYWRVATGLWDAVHATPGLDWPHRDVTPREEFERFASGFARAIGSAGLPERDAAAAARALLDIARVHAAPGAGGADTEQARVRSGAGLLLDGLRLRALERQAAAGGP